MDKVIENAEELLETLKIVKGYSDGKPYKIKCRENEYLLSNDEIRDILKYFKYLKERELIKIIDLINMIAKKEKVPEKIRYCNNIYIYLPHSQNYFCKISYELGNFISFDEDFNIFSILNDEVEVLEWGC